MARTDRRARRAGLHATAVLGLAVALLAACTPEDVTGSDRSPSPDGATRSGDGRRPVILDYSPTISDLGALMFLASHPDLRLIGVTLPGTGESHCEPGLAHTRGVLVAIGLPGVPVACGPEEPSTGWNAFPTSWRIASDEMTLPEAPPNETRSAPELISDLVHGEDQPVSVVAIAPLTNLAAALTEDPTLAGRLAGITIMGGAVDVPGNVFRNTVAEWNIWVDPTAAGVVIASGARVTLVPLDATNSVPTSPTFFEGLEDASGTPGSDLLLETWRARPDWYENPDGFVYLWDELAAATLADPSVVELEPARLVVHDDLRENKGWTRRDGSGAEVQVATSADRLAFESLFLGTVAGHPVELGYLTTTPDELAYFEELRRIGVRAGRHRDAVLARVAREMGIPEPPTEQEQIRVLTAALGELFAEVLTPQVAALRSLDVPASLAPDHRRFVRAWGAFLAQRDELIRAWSRALDFEVFASGFARIDEACAGLEAQKARRLLEIELRCAG